MAPGIAKACGVNCNDQVATDCSLGSAVGVGNGKDIDEIQFVWVYWHGGARNDELRWSIRSVLKNFVGRAKIMVVGDKPPWYDGPHIPVKRIQKGRYRAFRDSLKKLVTAVDDCQIDDEFVWMMDDIYMVRPVTKSQLKTRYYQAQFSKQSLAKARPANKWQRIKHATMKELAKNNLPMKDYATHLPQHVEKSKFKEVVKRFNPGSARRMRLWEVLYGNMFSEGDAKPVRSMLFRTIRKLPYTAYKKQNSHYVNNGNWAWNEALRGYLWESFPNKSKFEIIDSAAPKPWYATPVSRDKVVAIVPYRKTPEREKGWRWVRQFLAARCNEVVVAGCDDGPFNRSQAINNAFRRVRAKYSPDTVCIIADADCAIGAQQFAEAVAQAQHYKKLVIPHNKVCRMTEAQSDEVLRRFKAKSGTRERWFRNDRTRQCVSGLIAVRFDKFEEVNGFDEQFVGWGGEDNAFKLTCDKLLGESIRLNGTLFHFWHPRHKKEDRNSDNRKRYIEYRRASAQQIKSRLATKGLGQ